MAYRYIDLSLFSISVFVYGSQTYDPLPSIEHTPPPLKKNPLLSYSLDIWNLVPLCLMLFGESGIG